MSPFDPILPPLDRCDHSWKGLEVWIRCTIVNSDGEIEKIPDVAWCPVCDLRIELTPAETAAVLAAVDQRLAVERKLT